MVKILQKIHEYVPAIQSEAEVCVPSTGVTEKVKRWKFQKLLLGGDQLTCARVKGRKRDKSSEADATHRFDGLLPVPEDWHTKVCLLEVSKCDNDYK